MLTVFLHTDFRIFVNLRYLPRLCLFSLFASFKIFFVFEFYSATTQFLRKELSDH